MSAISGQSTKKDDGKDEKEKREKEEEVEEEVSNLVFYAQSTSGKK